MAEVFGERRRQLLRHLLRNRTGATVKELMQALGVTRTAVRQHVAALVRQGLVAPAAVLPSGGRPKTLFALTPAGREAVRRHYAWFGELLMDAVEHERDGTSLRRRITRIASAVLARARAQRPSCEERSKSVERLAALMDQLGYDARVARDADGAPAIEASHCIFHDVAMKRPEVCQFDLALLSGYAGRRVELRECMSRGGRVCRFRFAPKGF